MNKMNIQEFQIACRELCGKNDNPLYRMTEFIANQFSDLLSIRHKEFNRSVENSVFDAVEEMANGKITVNQELREIAKIHKHAYEFLNAVESFSHKYPEYVRDIPVVPEFPVVSTQEENALLTWAFDKKSN